MIMIPANMVTQPFLWVAMWPWVKKTLGNSRSWHLGHPTLMHLADWYLQLLIYRHPKSAHQLTTDTQKLLLYPVTPDTHGLAISEL